MPSRPDEQREDTDRLRSLLFLPSATVVVAEVERRVIGIGVLSIRPTVRSAPFIGVIDELGLEGIGRDERRARREQTPPAGPRSVARFSST